MVTASVRRAVQLKGAFGSWSVFVDGREVGKLTWPGASTTFKVAPGVHELKIQQRMPEIEPTPSTPHVKGGEAFSDPQDVRISASQSSFLAKQVKKGSIFSREETVVFRPV